MVVVLGGFGDVDENIVGFSVGRLDDVVGLSHYPTIYIESAMKRPGTRNDSADGGQSTEADKIAEWVKQTFTPTTVDGVTVYDLTTR